MRVLERIAAPITADPNGIAAAQTLAGAENFDLDGVGVIGGVATLAPPRRIVITSSGDDTGVDFTVTGTDRAGTAISEVVTGVNAGAATTNKLFATVTAVAADGATDGDAEVGWSAESISAWLFVGQHSRRHVNHLMRAIITTGETVDYIIEGTSQNILRDRVSGDHPDDLIDLTGSLTANYTTTLDATLVAYRLKVTTQTTSIKLRDIPTAN
jgi:hypothetical protein